MYAGRIVEQGRSRRCSTRPSTRTPGACSSRCRGSTSREPSACGRSRAAAEPDPRRRPAARSTRAARTRSPMLPRREPRAARVGSRATRVACHLAASATKRGASSSAAPRSSSEATDVVDAAPRGHATSSSTSRSRAACSSTASRAACTPSTASRSRRARRDARARRRDRLRQVDDSPGCSRACSSRRAARSLYDGTDITHWSQRAAPAAAPRDADDLPGPVLVAEPAPTGRHDHRRAAPDPRHRHEAGAPAPRPAS